MELTTLMDCAIQWGCRITEQAPMAAATSFHIGGPADVLIDIPSPDAVAAVVSCCQQQRIPFLVLGNGSNLLVGDKGFRGAVLRLKFADRVPTLTEDGILRCAAGISLTQLCVFARDHGLTGLEFAYGIPGTVGGAVYMNAGAYGGEMAQVLTTVTVVPLEGDDHTPVTLPADKLALGYRHSALMDRFPAIVVEAAFRLQPGDADAITARMKELMAKRQEKQPLEYPSAGSFFKRPEGHFAGALIEQAGLKGYAVGGAQVSEKHAGFVINRNHATAADVLALCRHVQHIIREKDGVELEPEVRFIGEF